MHDTLSVGDFKWRFQGIVLKTNLRKKESEFEKETDQKISKGFLHIIANCT